MLEGEKCILQGLPLTLPHISPLKNGYKGVFWLTLLQVGPKNPFQKGFALYQGPWLAVVNLTASRNHLGQEPLSMPLRESLYGWS